MFLKTILTVAVLLTSSVSAAISSLEDYYSVAVDAGGLYGINPCLILAVIEQEGGAVGEDTVHSNGNTDTGIAQINKNGAWMSYFKEKYDISHSQIRDNPLVSVMLVSYILRKELDRSDNDLIYMLSAYHAGYGNRRSIRGLKYSKSVLDRFIKISKKRSCM